MRLELPKLGALICDVPVRVPYLPRFFNDLSGDNQAYSRYETVV